jgi:hypothetical protein
MLETAERYRGSTNAELEHPLVMSSYISFHINYINITVPFLFFPIQKFTKFYIMTIAPPCLTRASTNSEAKAPEKMRMENGWIFF